MSDLSIQSSHDYWKQYTDPIIYKVLCCMESVETPKDQNTLFKIMLQELGKTLEQVTDMDFNQLEQRVTFIKVANYLHMTQVLRLLQVLDTSQPGFAAQLLLYAEKISQESTDQAGLLLQRNLVFERLRLLSRLFAEERLQLIENALSEA